ncbi:hypothetical protein PINS_up023548 [Pythium insidiosum]|nr:hypothetical protein PINS_up023548 [Pythium insidiosum]
MAHSCYEGYLTDVDIIGAEECPIVIADIKIEARLHRSNIALLFPNVLSDDALVQRLIGQKVTYRGRSYVRFSPDGRIQQQWLNVSFIGGLLGVCGNVEDVARLLDDSPISALGTIHVDPRRQSSRDIAEQEKEWSGVEWGTSTLSTPQISWATNALVTQLARHGAHEEDARSARRGGCCSHRLAIRWYTHGENRARGPEATATPRPRAPSSERGRAFRRRQQQHEDELEAAVQRLRREVQEKQFLQSVWEAKQLRLRHSQLGSSVRTILEYHELFRKGLKLPLAETGAHRATARAAPRGVPAQRDGRDRGHGRRAGRPRGLARAVAAPHGRVPEVPARGRGRPHRARLGQLPGRHCGARSHTVLIGHETLQLVSRER